MTPDDYCQRQVPGTGSSFYYCQLYCDNTQRRGINAIKALTQTLSGIERQCSEPALAHSKLAWWRQEIQALFNDSPSHPITQALLPHLRQSGLESTLFFDMLDGWENHIDQSFFHHQSEIQHFTQLTSASSAQIISKILGYQDAHTIKYARQLGIATAMARHLKHLHQDLRQDKLYFAQERLQNFQVTDEMLTQPETTTQCRALFADQATQIEQQFQQAENVLPDIDRQAQLFGLTHIALWRAWLREINAEDYLLQEHQLQITPLRKLWIAWRTKKHCQRRNRHHR